MMEAEALGAWEQQALADWEAYQQQYYEDKEASRPSDEAIVTPIGANT